MVIHIRQYINLCPAPHAFRDGFLLLHTAKTPHHTVCFSIFFRNTHQIKTVPFRLIFFFAITDIDRNSPFFLQAGMHRSAKYLFIFRINKNRSIMVLLYIIFDIKKDLEPVIFYRINHCPIFFYIIFYQSLMVLLCNHPEKFILLFLFFLLPHSNLLSTAEPDLPRSPIHRICEFQEPCLLLYQTRMPHE